jgi:2-oxoglutarate dehydrogenase E1 component
MAADFSPISNAHPEYIENLYISYRKDPNAIDPSWSYFFNGFDYASDNGTGITTNGSTNGQGAVPTTVGLDVIPQKEMGVMLLIDGYRHRGHLLSTTNPLKPRRDRQPHLAPKEYGLTDEDLSKTFMAGETLGLKNATLQQIITRLEGIYAGNIGFEYSHIDRQEQRLWLRERIENDVHTEGYALTENKKRRILEKLNEAVGFEDFLGKKFIGKKRFSLEGGESTISGIDSIINEGAMQGVEEVVIGMAHRGRLNVLVNTLGKTYDSVFNEFAEDVISDLSYGSGDVKYHLGYSSQVKTLGGQSVYLKLLPNPSHLEAVDPLVVGYARAKADILYKSNFDKILPIMIHGDAAVAGQGIVYETLQMSNLKGYHAGGTVHFVINNQIGFTTDFEDARTSTYCSSVATTVQAPTFHVNGDDPEAVAFVCELAVAFRQEFNLDVFIDMVCYRRWGHNESDNPEFTQPLMWKEIKKHANPRTLYIEQLMKRNEVSKELAETMMSEYDKMLQDLLSEVKQNHLPYKRQDPEEQWRSLTRGKDITDDLFDISPETGIDPSVIEQITGHLMKIPTGFAPLKDIARYLSQKEKLLNDSKIDWGYGELMAYSSLLLEGRNVRLSGEDVKRGTFSHRHVCFFDAETNKEYNRIDTISDTQGRFYVYNSLLSEYAVLGFEYGYGLASPDHLVIWEAQFGDFNNGAQTIIDQFIAAGETKWGRQNGLVMLLPHGYEGQGPEHSSARLERFMQLCAENNMTVANVTTPANYFHLIRRQLVRNFRKPLVIMSPKSLLRHPEVISDIKDFTTGTRFQEVIDDPLVLDAQKVRKVLFCSGKIYYDLLAKQRGKIVEGNAEAAITDVAIVRVEQLYPFPEKQIKAILAKYPNAKPLWVQEESINMGAWSFIATFHGELGMKPIARKMSASPASGFVKIHNVEQAAIIDEAFS